MSWSVMECSEDWRIMAKWGRMVLSCGKTSQAVLEKG